MSIKYKREKFPPTLAEQSDDDNNDHHHNDEGKTALKILKRTIKEAANPKVSRFNNWETERLKKLLVENNIQIRGSANTAHSTLVRICDEVFGPFDDHHEDEEEDKDEEALLDASRNNEGNSINLGSNLNSSFTFEDLAEMNLAAMKIQKLFIASRKRLYEKMFSQQDCDHENHDQEYCDQQHQHQHQQEEEEYYYDEYQEQRKYNDGNQSYDKYEECYDAEVVPFPSAPHLEDENDYYCDDDPELNEEYSCKSYDEMTDVSRKGNEDSNHFIDTELNGSLSHDEVRLDIQQSEKAHLTEGEEEDMNQLQLDEELEVEWRKPSWKFAKKYEAENRPHKSGKGMKKYDWKRDTLGRHCTMGGCGEQLDLWNEGATSEFSQFGSGITNYFKFLKWCSWIMLILSFVHVPAIIINILADSSGTQYESLLAKTTLGNLGNAEDVDYISITGCKVDSYQFDACRWKKNHLALLYSSLDVIGTTIVIIGWVWLRAFEKREVDHLNRSTVNASDYTVRVKEVPPKTKEREMAAHFADVTNAAVAEVSLAYKNSQAIQFYVARGKIMKDRINCIQRIRYEKSTLKGKNSTRQIERKIRKLLDERKRLTAQIAMRDEERKEQVESKSEAIQAFVTFETEEGFLKAISSYQINWFRNFLFYPKKLLFKGNRLKLSQAPEPSTIIWENLETSSKSRFCRKCFTTFVASLAVLMSIYFTFLAKEFREELVEQTNKDCPDYVDSLSIDDLGALVRRNNDLSHCYCNRLDPQEQWNDDVCVEYVKGALKASAMNYGASFMVVFMNMFFTLLMDMAGSFEKHESLDAMQSSNMTRLFLLKFVNTGCLILMYTITPIQAIVGVMFDDPQNFNVDWFETGGVSMIIVMCINIISPHITSLIQYRAHRKKIWKLETKGLTKEKETKDVFKVWYTQEDLNAVYLGPQFRLNYRYAQCLVNFFICWMYSISMPVLPFIGALSFYVSYWIDKFLFCNFYQTPPKYSDDIGSNSSSLIGFGIILHLAMSCWILGSNQIFVGQNVFQNYSFSYRWTNAMFKQHVIPLEVLGILFIMVLITRKSLVTFSSTLVKFLRCLTCSSSGNIRRLTKTLNTVQVGYSAARARGVIKGLATYNILQNPKYQEAFSISSDFAASHRRLNAIKGFNTKEGGLCVSESSRDSEDTSSKQV